MAVYISEAFKYLTLFPKREQQHRLKHENTCLKSEQIVKAVGTVAFPEAGVSI